MISTDGRTTEKTAVLDVPRCWRGGMWWCCCFEKIMAVCERPHSRGSASRVVVVGRESCGPRGNARGREKGAVWWPGRYMPWTAGGWRHALRAGTCGVRMSHGGHNNLAGALNEARFALDAQPHMKLDYTLFSAPCAPPWPTAFPTHDDHATCRASRRWPLTHTRHVSKHTHNRSPAYIQPREGRRGG